MNVPPHETEEISISTTKALKMAAKWSILNSITKSKRMIPENETNLVAGFLTIPVMRIIAANSLEELQSLKITQVQWCDTLSLGFTLSNGQSCTVGESDCEKNYTFDPAKKITKVECIIFKTEDFISQINFYHHQQRLVAVGYDDEYYYAKKS